VNIYRIDKNYERMNASHRQLGFPEFNGGEMIELTKKLIELDKDWIPERPLHSMYIRPFSIAMDNKIGMN
jgi:branched-chain amino acid aminotransferase